MTVKDLNNKIFSVWKPSGIFSNDIIYHIREKYLVKAGHAGTLDPFAEGVVVVCTGNRTKDIAKENDVTLSCDEMGDVILEEIKKSESNFI